MKDLQLPKQFVETIHREWPQEANALLESIESKAHTSIRLNPFKNHPGFQNEEKIPWSKSGYYLKTRPAFYADPYFHVGAYYVQEASSMIVEYILNQLDLPKEELLALDLCAAPGGKSTILSTFLKDKGVLISNEIVWKRNLILQENLERWGQSNTIITHNNSSDFSSLSNLFDVVLIDAPCSGEGMFRKDPKVISEWSEKNVEICCQRQESILTDITPSIKKDGYLIYSTCTYNLAENEKQILSFMQNGDFQCVEIEGIEAMGVRKSVMDNITFYRLFPHRLNGEGLSICVLRRKFAHGKSNKTHYKSNSTKFELRDDNPGQALLSNRKKYQILSRENELFAIESGQTDELLKRLKPLRLIKFGTHIGDLNRKDFIPSHALALSSIYNDTIPEIKVNSSDALRILQRDSSNIKAPQSDDKWLRLTFDGNNLAFAKNLGNRINIQLPKTFRIRKNIDEFL